MKTKNVLFIHRSVGHNLIVDGDLRDILERRDSNIDFSDYDQNTDTLTDAEGNEDHPCFTFPNGNTRPADYAQIFSTDCPKAYKLILDNALKYSVIMLKSCYPNSNIHSRKQLNQIKEDYLSIFGFFKQHPDKLLVVMTSPPLAPLMTSRSSAKRARKLSDWLEGGKFGDNIHVFNLFDILAAPGGRLEGRLAKGFRKALPFDSHPNKFTSEQVAPLVVTCLSEHI